MREPKSNPAWREHDIDPRRVMADMKKRCHVISAIADKLQSQADELTECASIMAPIDQTSAVLLRHTEVKMRGLIFQTLESLFPLTELLQRLEAEIQNQDQDARDA